MKSRSVRGWLDLLRDWARAGGRDAYLTTRRSLLSIEARTGSVLFLVLWLLSRLSAGPERFWWAEAGLILAHAGAGALWGIVVRSAWEGVGLLVPRVNPGRFRPRARAFPAGAAVLALHGLWLFRDLARRPDLYAAGLDGALGTAVREAAARTHPAVLAGMLGGVGLILLLAGLRGAYGLARWFFAFSRQTRLAIWVLGGAALAGVLGVLMVRRVQLEGNLGPNLILISVDGLRADSLTPRGPAPRVGARVGGAAFWVRCLPPSSALAPVLATALTGRSPLSHGIRDDHASEDSYRRLSWEWGTFPGLLRERGYALEYLTDAGGGFFGRVAGEFSGGSAPDTRVPARRLRRALERSPHLMAYLSGSLGRRLVPVLRGVPALAEPRLLAREARRRLRALRWTPRFFLWVHFSAPELWDAPPAPARYRGRISAWDEAVHRLLAGLERSPLADRTTVALWSPRASPLTEAEILAARELRGGSLFLSPFLVWSPGRSARRPPRSEPVRAEDVPATLADLLGVEVPEGWTGFPLLRAAPGGEAGILYTELAPSAREGAPGCPPLAQCLIEDRERPGELRVDPAWTDPFLLFRPRMVQLGTERLIYRPAPEGPRFIYHRLGPDLEGKADLAQAPAWAERVRDLREIFFRHLAQEAGWRPQNDFWIPEAFLREVPAETPDG